MDIALTGSTGLIGTRLAERLTSAGHRVLRFVRGEAGSATETDSARWDPEKGKIDAAALEGIDAVVHLAGAPIGDRRWTSARKALLHDSRTKGTTLIAQSIAAAKRPPTTFLSGSAVGFYGDTGDTPTDESGRPGSDYLARLCIDWEAATTAASDAGVRTVLLRSGVVLAGEGGALARQLPFFKLGLGGRSGSGRQYQSWISLDDETAAIEWLLTSDHRGPVNLTAPEPVTNAVFASTLGLVLHRPTTVIPMAGPRLLFGRELADTLLLTSQRVVPHALLTGDFRFRHASLDDALHEILR